MFNLFNHTEFKNPDTNINSGAFGQVIDTYNHRLNQFAARFTFLVNRRFKESVQAGPQDPAPFLHAFLSEIGMESPDFHCHKTPLAKIAAPSVGKDRPVFHIPAERCYDRFN